MFLIVVIYRNVAFTSSNSQKYITELKQKTCHLPENGPSTDRTLYIKREESTRGKKATDAFIIIRVGMRRRLHILIILWPFFRKAISPSPELFQLLSHNDP